MKMAPVAIGAEAAIAVGIFVTLSVGQTSRVAEINFVESFLQGPLPCPVVRLFHEP